MRQDLHHTGLAVGLSTLHGLGTEKTLLNSALSTPWTFLRPTTELYANSVGSAKHFLDSLALSISDSQSARQRCNRKRKRSEIDQDSVDQVLQLRQLYVEGFSSDQIWEQASRILNSAGQEVEHDYALSVRGVAPSSSHARTSPAHSDSAILEAEESEYDDSTNSVGSVMDDSSSRDGDVNMETLELGDLSHDESEPHSQDEESDRDAMFEESNNDESGQDTYTEDPFGLNDGFFSIDDFNRQSQLLERQDAKGGLDHDVESDEEEVDWHANPLAAGNSFSISKDQSTRNLNSSEAKETMHDDSSDEEGPTFDHINVQDDSDSEDGTPTNDLSEATGWVDTSDIKYSDFFAPPPRKITSKNSRPLPKTQPREGPSDNDVDRAMADVRRDLFEEEASIAGSDVSNDDSGSKAQRSTHEKQRARIADEIRRLEAANVAKKEWMLAGEARGVERPVNSLIEEDLEFERIGKPVPVVTAEVSEDIEELVKRRILAKEFDEVLRRRPGVSDRGDAKRARFELDDAKPQQGLADMYETDHLRATDSNYVDLKDQKLAREHAEIANLWKEVSSQLDTLSNWHYKPRVPQANINVVTDVATITMEDAQPNASSAVRSGDTLAPQEIYTPGGDGKVSGELVLKNGMSVAKEEMTREDKGRLRRQLKKQKKAGVDQANKQPSKAAEKQQIVSDLKKGGVKVIGKRGEVTDVEGNKFTGSGVRNGADTLKL